MYIGYIGFLELEQSRERLINGLSLLLSLARTKKVAPQRAEHPLSAS